MAPLLIFAFFSSLLIGVLIAFCLGFTGLIGLWQAGVITRQLVPQRIFIDSGLTMAITLFVSSAIGGVSIKKLTRAILPFMLVEILVLFLVSLFPETILIVPRVFGYA
jgi:hypothetical protein